MEDLIKTAQSKRILRIICALLLSLSSCGPGLIQREQMRQDSLAKTVYIGGVKVITIDSCEYIVGDNGFRAGITIIHKENCRNHASEKSK